MCCLVGCAGTLSHTHREAFAYLLWIGSTRGPSIDSTGVASITRPPKPDVDLFKLPINAIEFTQHKRFEKIVTHQSAVLIGHNRRATTGKITANNAHPFEFGHIIGAHNGHLRNRYSLENGADFDVDSEALFFNFYKNGALKTIPQVEGAYALTWFDTKENRLNFVRNDERPLFYVFTKDRQAMFWASEFRMLAFVASKLDVKFDKVYELPKDQLFSYLLPAPNQGFDPKKHYRVPLAGKEPGFHFHANNHGSFWGVDYSENKDVTPPAKNTASSATAVVPFQPPYTPPADKTTTEDVLKQRLEKKAKGVYYTGWKGEQLDMMAFEKATSRGCEWCQTNIAWGDKVRFLSRDSALCDTCFPSVKDYSTDDLVCGSGSC